MPRSLPLTTALMNALGRTGFHMPGHAGGRAFSTSQAASFLQLDNTELSVLDDLNRPVGAVLASERIASEVFGSARTLYVTTGSTTSLKTALAACVPVGGTLCLTRNVHKAVVHAAAELDLKLLFLPAAPDTGHPLPIPGDASLVEAPFDALILTSPDYYGNLVDLAPYATFAHAQGASLIVDAAHGSHLVLDPDLKAYRALEKGADLVVESAHKTLAALTPGSFLHIGLQAHKRLDLQRADDMLRVFQTSSPSFPVAASLEYAVHLLSKDGARLLKERKENLIRFESLLPGTFRRYRTACSDPLRLVMDVSGSGHSAARVDTELAARGIDIEMRDFTRLVLIVSLWQDPNDFARLLKALQEISELPVKREDEALLLQKRLAALLHQLPVFVQTPREALFGRGVRRRVSPGNAIGLVAAETVAPTPPCIPLIWPGERISQEQAALAEAILPAGATLLVLDA